MFRIAIPASPTPILRNLHSPASILRMVVPRRSLTSREGCLDEVTAILGRRIGKWRASERPIKTGRQATHSTGAG